MNNQDEIVLFSDVTDLSLEKTSRIFLKFGVARDLSAETYLAF